MEFLKNPKLLEIKTEIKEREKWHGLPDFKKIEEILFKNKKELKEIKEFIKNLEKNKLIEKEIKIFLIRGLNNWKNIDNLDKLCALFIFNELRRGNLWLRS